jgi:hypothetical protein
MFQDDYFKYCTSRWKLNQLQAKQPAAPTTPGVALLPHRDAATLVVNGKGPSGLTHLRGQRVFSGGGKENKISWNVEMSYYIIYIYIIYILSSSTSKHKFSAFTQKDMIGRTKNHGNPLKSMDALLLKVSRRDSAVAPRQVCGCFQSSTQSPWTYHGTKWTSGLYLVHLKT